MCVFGHKCNGSHAAFMKGMGENVSEDEEKEEKKGSLTSERVGGAGGGFPVCLCFPSTVESPGGQQCL